MLCNAVGFEEFDLHNITTKHVTKASCTTRPLGHVQRQVCWYLRIRSLLIRVTVIENPKSCPPRWTGQCTQRSFLVGTSSEDFDAQVEASQELVYDSCDARCVQKQNKVRNTCILGQRIIFYRCSGQCFNFTEAFWTCNRRQHVSPPLILWDHKTSNRAFQRLGKLTTSQTTRTLGIIHLQREQTKVAITGFSHCSVSCQHFGLLSRTMSVPCNSMFYCI